VIGQLAKSFGYSLFGFRFGGSISGLVRTDTHVGIAVSFGVGSRNSLTCFIDGGKCAGTAIPNDGSASATRCATQEDMDQPGHYAPDQSSP